MTTVLSSSIHRIKHNNSFSYPGANKDDLERIKKLRIPPQWNNVEITKDKTKKIQVTGYDVKKRKQYIYHPEWIKIAKEEKFKAIKKFSYTRYKNIINKYINLKNLSSKCIICNMLKIMEDLNIRVGNDIYLRDNNSIGLTTMMKKNLKGDVLSFRGKKGIFYTKVIKDSRTKEFIRKILRIQSKFLFINNNGERITHHDLNTFLKQEIGEGITCKDIRTYNANVIFLNYMRKLTLPENASARKKNLISGIKYTAEKLGNTPKVCRDSYISPDNINKFV